MKPADELIIILLPKNSCLGKMFLSFGATICPIPEMMIVHYVANGSIEGKLISTSVMHKKDQPAFFSTSMSNLGEGYAMGAGEYH